MFVGSAKGHIVPWFSVSLCLKSEPSHLGMSEMWVLAECTASLWGPLCWEGHAAGKVPRPRRPGHWRTGCPLPLSVFRVFVVHYVFMANNPILNDVHHSA